MSRYSRSASIDNIKGVLIFFVVFGHLIEMRITGDHFLRSIWIFIYSFHMPMFALVSGMFSKATLEERDTSQLVKNIAVPLIAFELLYEAVEFFLKGKLSVYSGLIAPYWMLWYLLSLLSWRLLLPLFSRLQFPVLSAIVLAMLATYSEHIGYTLSLSRTLNFFPFFLLGWGMRSDAFSRLPKKLTLLSGLVVALALIASFLLKSEFDYRWLYGSYSLNRLGMANLSGSLYQALQYLLSGTIGLAVLHLLVQRDLGLANVGKRSMYVFLWHGLALVILQETGIINDIFELDDVPTTVLSVGISALIVWACSREACENLTQKLVLRPLSWLLSKPFPGAADASKAVAAGNEPATAAKAAAVK
ncbi:acyltransferase family protein [Undibacterium sp.]|jgi:fucose 4-O-acetylase-like acetyltransferase|uniref:acyltransferase family protein n=1 Tax=Undibacterium sp. TaxID=1914977 RepID=UPI002B982766|nr:acyltransferase family protein [Undibacterium sp.]HTD03058.1 acyltransferase family protein [Undibacterium sp.]